MEPVKLAEVEVQIEEPPTPNPTTVIAACSVTTVVSVAMLLLNKAILLSIPFGGGLVLLQNTFTVFLVQALNGCRFPEGLGWRAVLNNIPCAILFGATTFTSMVSLSYLSVTTFTILKNAQFILSYPLDYILRGERLKLVSMYLLASILLGTCAYCSQDMSANIVGILWALAHLISITLYTVLTKMRLAELVDENKLRQTLDLAWYNNILSFPVVCAAAAVQATQIKSPLIKPECGMHCWIMVVLSCFGGCAMSVIGLKTQALMSPVTYLTFNNLNKIPAMLISAAIWPHLETADTTQEIMGVVLTIYSGFLFALSKQGDVHPVALFISIAMSIAIIPLMVLGERAGQPHSGANVTGARP
jgi:hypothetical protein